MKSVFTIVCRFQANAFIIFHDCLLYENVPQYFFCFYYPGTTGTDHIFYLA